MQERFRPRIGRQEQGRQRLGHPFEGPLRPGRGLLDAKNWDMLRLGAAGWWAGWLSATIARAGYPPPRKLTEAGQRRLEKVSLVLVLLGFVNFFRLLITGRRRAGGTADGSS